MTEKVVSAENLEEVKQVGTVIKLSRPFNWEDKDYSELVLDFDKLSGDDLIAIDSDFMAFIKGKRNVFVQFKDEHPAYHMATAAKAAGVDPFMIKALPMRDALKVTGAAKDFLNGLV